MTTTTQIVTRSRLQVYETLEIKRRYRTGWEASWVDVTGTLLFSSATRISNKLDFDDYGYGEFKVGDASFLVNNVDGLWSPEGTLYSLFEAAYSRHYTKVRYRAGYKDTDGSEIDEVVFSGLLNEKTASQDFNTGQFKFTALSTSSLLSEKTILNGRLTPVSTVSQTIETILTDSSIQQIVNYSPSNIAPGFNFTFENASYYETKNVSEALTEIAKKSNSVWYVDSSENLIFRARATNVTSPFAFVGGDRQRRDTNIVSIESYDMGHTKIINEVDFDADGTKYQVQPDINNIYRYGTNKIDFSGTDITNPTTINSIGHSIVNAQKVPKKRIVLSTIYMPNVISFLDGVTIDYKPSPKYLPNKTQLILNQGMDFNDGNYIGQLKNRLIIEPNKYWAYYGADHDAKAGLTRHYLVEDISI